MPHADNLSRALLALILLCLVVGVLRDDGGASGAPGDAPEAAALQTPAERYTIGIIGLNRKPPLMLRTDTATGQAWIMGVLGRGPWEALREAPEGVPSAGADEPGRYEVYSVKLRRGAPNLVRVDHLTGRIWRKGSTNGGAWVAVPNPGEQPPVPDAGADADADADAELAAADDVDDADTETSGNEAE